MVWGRRVNAGASALVQRGDRRPSGSGPGTVGEEVGGGFAVIRQAPGATGTVGRDMSRACSSPASRAEPSPTASRGAGRHGELSHDR
jgi:hypothetical protein